MLCRYILAIAAMLAIHASTVQAQAPLRIGYFDIPPHVTGVEEGHPKGAAVSYFERYIAPHFGVPFEWNPEVTAPTRLMSQLREGEIDAMIFLGKTAERTKVFYYPAPYLVIPETVAVRTEHPLGKISTVSDLHGLRLGFLVGGRIPEQMRSENIIYDLIAGKRLMERNLEKLLLGRIDGIYAPLSTALVNIAEQMGVRDEIKLLPIEFLGPVELYTVFSRKSVTQEIVDRYNEALGKAESEIYYKDFIGDFLKEDRD